MSFVVIAIANPPQGINIMQLYSSSLYLFNYLFLSCPSISISLSLSNSFLSSFLLLILICRQRHFNRYPSPISHYFRMKVRYIHPEFSASLSISFGGVTSLPHICIHFLWHCYWRCCTASNWNIPAQRHCGWGWLGWHKASPGSAGEVQ